MRSIIAEQLPLMPAPIDHAHARELHTIDDILNEHPEIEKLVWRDLIANVANPDKGRKGLNAEQVLRILVLKQLTGFSYQQLAFHLADSSTYCRFCRFGGFDKPLKASALQENIAKLTPETIEQINRTLIGVAMEEGWETGEVVRTDCTVVESNILHPTDSHLLFDTVRVLVRLMRQARDAGFKITWNDHTRRAKRRMMGIRNAKGQEKKKGLYRDLLKVTEKTLAMADRAIEKLRLDGRIEALSFQLELSHFQELGHKVCDQTRRRVFAGEKVPAREKIVSIFEEHTDIIIKDRREVQYGHKICLSGGASNLILDCVIQEGNPADSTLAVEMVERLQAITGKLPKEVAFDGGFASGENLTAIKKLEVAEVVFNKKRGLSLEEMVSESWIYKRLSRFRAGIEGVISFLKRVFGLDRCTWKGWKAFQRYVWSSIISANLLQMARHRLRA